jgi:hypothetical protein
MASNLTSWGTRRSDNHFPFSGNTPCTCLFWGTSLQFWNHGWNTKSPLIMLTFNLSFREKVWRWCRLLKSGVDWAKDRTLVWLYTDSRKIFT